MYDPVVMWEAVASCTVYVPETCFIGERMMKKYMLGLLFSLLALGCMACAEEEKCHVEDTVCIQECISMCDAENKECLETCVDLSTANSENTDSLESQLSGIIPQELMVILLALLKSGII
jgi:hypothetical protein